MEMIVWIIFGALAGWIASVVVDNGTHYSIRNNLIFGVIGAALGGFIVSASGYGEANGLDMYSIVAAVMGAVISLVIYNGVSTRA
jgi:uncharacterized membrane protein YeaQ/YmgE (transglycosylase-associated protein family)